MVIRTAPTTLREFIAGSLPASTVLAPDATVLYVTPCPSCGNTPLLSDRVVLVLEPSPPDIKTRVYHVGCAPL